MQDSTIQAIAWHDDHIAILDQTRLPGKEEYLICKDLEAVAGAIERLSIRGAPAIGVAAAMGMAFACLQDETSDSDAVMAHLEHNAERLLATRPTAVNLRWAVERMMETARGALPEGVQAVKERLKAEALAIHEDDVTVNRNMGACGQEIVPETATVITICNTGSLATGGYGTALGVIRSAVAAGKKVFVAACETRPLLQGARLTAWELQKDGIPFELITDNMAGNYMKRKGADVVIAGADRIAANGDAANKIGTYSLAILAKEHGIPFYIAAPTSTIDMSVASGDDIPIEERNGNEITCIRGQHIAPREIKVWNPAFDVVPSAYIAGIITEKGIVRAPYRESIEKLF